MKNIISKATSWYFSKRALPFWGVLVLDCIIVLASGLLADVLQNRASNTLGSFGPIMRDWRFFLLCFLVGFRVMHTYSGVIRYSSFIDLMRIALGNFIGAVLSILLTYIPAISQLLGHVSRTDIGIAFVLATVLMWALRIMVKYTYDIYFVSNSAQRVFIYGVKEGGIALAKLVHSRLHL